MAPISKNCHSGNCRGTGREADLLSGRACSISEKGIPVVGEADDVHTEK